MMCRDEREGWKLKSLLKKWGSSALSSLAMHHMECELDVHYRTHIDSILFTNSASPVLKLHMKASNFWNDLEVCAPTLHTK